MRKLSRGCDKTKVPVGNGVRWLLLSTALFAACTEVAPPPKTATRATVTPRTTEGAPDADAKDPRKGRLYVVWSPGGLGPRAEDRIEAMGGDTVATTVVTGTKWLEDASSGPVPPDGYAIPLDVAYVDPRSYERVVDAPRLLARLERDTIVFAESAQRTARGILSVRLDGVGYAARDLLTDEQMQGYEAFLAGPPPRGWGARFLLVRTSARAAALRATARRLSERPVAVVKEGDTPYLRYAHSTTPYVFFKEHLGEFAARPLADGSIEIDPGWLQRNIVDRHVPLLGRVRCHKDFIPQLSTALATVIDEGRARFVKTDQYAGCFSPRFIGREAGGRLSAHAWGAAVDVNAAENPLGEEPTMHTDVVRAFQAAGFNWGGEWLIPDGMHFEWARPLGA